MLLLLVQDPEVGTCTNKLFILLRNDEQPLFILGYTSAIRCAKLGKSVAIVERDLLGGHAVNWGCIPLNAMIASARLIRSIHESARYGIDISSHRIEFSRIARHRDEVVTKVRSQIKHFLEK
jgi:dihydrolipoamide dehydrogenase